MAPPNFVRNKKRKSRSRSSKRTPKNQIRTSQSVDKENLQDSSLETAGTSVDPLINYKDTRNLDNFKDSLPKSKKGNKGFSVKKGSVKTTDLTSERNSEFISSDSPLLLTLANEVAENAINRASSSLNNSHNSLKEASNSTLSSGAITSVTMVEKSLNELSTLLDQLSFKYASIKSNTVQKSDMMKLIPNNLESRMDFKYPDEKNISSQEDKIGLTREGQDDLTQEEKQKLRKAKKEAKKQGKPLAQNIQENDKIVPTTMSKAELKEERRKKQEAQRALKMEKEKEQVKKEEIPEPPSVKNKKIKEKSSVITRPFKQIPLLGHLTSKTGDVDLNVIHPAVRAMGLSMKDRLIDGCNARVLAALSAISNLIEDYSTPQSCDLSRDLSELLVANVAYLHLNRPLFEPMNNTIRFVKREINNIGSSVPEIQAKEELLSSIQTYIDQNITLASKTIVNNAAEIIESGDVILTYGYSLLVLETIKFASSSKENISVIVVDNPVPASGRSMLSHFLALGIKTYYRVTPNVSAIMNKVTKVLIEAEAIVLNGAMMANCGTAGIILQASTLSIPVISLCHTYKFCNIDLSDSLVVNELADAEEIINNPSARYENTLIHDWKQFFTLNIVNLVYDVTPAEMISVLVTERNVVPTCVVPTIIKRNFADILSHD